MNLVIRPFARSDEDALFLLMKDWDKDYEFSREIFSESLNAILGLHGNELILAFDGDTLVGYAQIIECRYLGFKPSLEVMQLLVAADRRSGGVGRRIMSYVEDLARRRGLEKVHLHSQVMRSRAHVFYEGLGYEFTKISKFYEKKLGG